MLLDGQIQMRFCAAAVFSASLPRHMAPFSAAWWHAHGLGVAQPHRRRVRPHPRVRACQQRYRCHLEKNATQMTAIVAAYPRRCSCTAGPRCRRSGGRRASGCRARSIACSSRRESPPGQIRETQRCVKTGAAEIPIAQLCSSILATVAIMREGPDTRARCQEERHRESDHELCTENSDPEFRPGSESP